MPSVARAFIWIALQALGIDSRIIRALAALYCNNIHFMKSASGVRFAFVAMAGVRQGCPLSSTIFVIITDCIMRALHSAVKSRDIVRGFADDLATVVDSVWESGPRLCSVFIRIERISRLSLKGKKCVDSPVDFQ